MKAAVYHRFGGPEVLQVVEVPEPKMFADQVRIHIKAAALNPADLGFQAGVVDALVDSFFPVIPGWDVAGIVAEAGIGTTGFKPGDEVIGFVRGAIQRYGSYAEQIAAEPRQLARKPANLDWGQAAGLPLVGLTAYQAMVHALGVREGETVLVHGAAGGVGHLAVQIAVARGASVIGTASEPNHDSPRDTAAARSCSRSPEPPSLEELPSMSDSVSVSVQTRINVPLEKAWQVLTDFGSYRTWHPVLTLEPHVGPLAVGTLLQGQSSGGPAGEQPVAFTIALVQEPNYLAWTGGDPEVVAGRHSFQLEQLGDGTTRFIESEVFTGPAAPEVIGGQLPALHAAYETSAAAFKNCVEEALAGGNPPAERRPSAGSRPGAGRPAFVCG